MCHRRRAGRRCKTAELCVELSWLRQSRATTGTAATGTGAASPLALTDQERELAARRAVEEPWKWKRENPPHKTAATARCAALRSPVGGLAMPRRATVATSHAIVSDSTPSLAFASRTVSLSLWRASRVVCAKKQVQRRAGT